MTRTKIWTRSLRDGWPYSRPRIPNCSDLSGARLSFGASDLREKLFMCDRHMINEQTRRM